MDGVLAFALIAVVIVVMPGPDMALVLKHGVRGGRRAAIAAALGVNTGLLVWAAAAAVGLAALIQASSTLLTALKLAGALYLIWLGLRTLHTALTNTPSPAAPKPHPAAGRTSPFREGLLSNLVNPKIAVVYTTLIPQFVTSNGSAALQTIVLAGVLLALGLVWLTAYALLVARLGTWLRRSPIQRCITAITGAALTLLGTRLAVQRH
jgi:threonine/homoserine/homoserine lactone efflux protein